MALAKVYDTADTVMVPMDTEDTEGLESALYSAAAVLDNSYHKGAEAEASLLRRAAEAVSDARTAAGLD